jgi:hypothetical protein
VDAGGEGLVVLMLVLVSGGSSSCLLGGLAADFDAPLPLQRPPSSQPTGGVKQPRLKKIWIDT